MVNVANVVGLPETPLSWPSKIPRIEDGWWPTGGAVDAANDGGIANWQAQELGKRTRWIYEVLMGGLNQQVRLGGEIVPDNTTGAKLQVNGFARTGAVIMHPHAGDLIAGAVQAANPKFVMLRLDGKLAFGRAENIVWSHDDGARSHLQSGYERFPDGLIMQWGYVSSNAATGVTFPLAFPNGCLWAAAFGAFADASRVAAFSTWQVSQTGMNIVQASVVGGATSWRWLAFGT